MAFLKLENFVINTAYVAAVRLDGEAHSGDARVLLLMAAPKPPFPQVDAIVPTAQHYEWVEFTGEAARVLKDYFSSFNHVVDLLPCYQQSAKL